MNWQDRIKEQVTDAIGGAINLFGTVAVDSFEKAISKAKDRDGQQNLPPNMPEPADEGAKSLMVDPFAIIDQLGFKDRPTGLSYWTLDEMSTKVPIYTGILQTRIHQVANFAIPQQQDREPGYKIVMRDKQKNATKAEQNEAHDLEQWLLYTGSTRKIGKDNFETFLQKITRDSYVYDQACFEIVDNRKGLPSDFYAVDGSTIRIADVPLGAEIDDDEDRVRYVQVYDEVVIAEFAAHEMCFGIRNPRTGIRLNGYGFSELEMMVNVITALLWGFEYNRKFFSQGSTTKGILNFRGSIPPKQLDAFRRHWYSLITGVVNAWRTPVTNAEELQYINLHSSNRDMEFAAWMDFLIKLACGICQFDPAEIGFVYGNTGQTSQMFQAPAEARIKSSKDKGLRPILRKLANWINHYLIWRINEDFEIQFTGMDPRSSDQIADLQKKQSSYLKTVDEVRAEDDLEPLPDGKGEVILDPTWLQFAQAKDMAQQQEEGGDDFGGFDEGQPEEEEEEEEAKQGEQEQEQEPEQEPLAAEKSLMRKAHVTEKRTDNNTFKYTIEVD